MLTLSGSEIVSFALISPAAICRRMVFVQTPRIAVASLMVYSIFDFLGTIVRVDFSILSSNLRCVV